MRYTRFEFRGQSGIGLKLIIGYLILISIIGIAIGFILFQFFGVPSIFVADDNETNEYILYHSITPRKYYAIQGGVFSNIKNAETMVNIIKSAEEPAFIYRDEKYYRIISYSGANYELISKKISDYKISGLDYIIKEVNITAKDAPDSYKNDNKYAVLSNIINDMGEALDSFIEETAKFEDKKIDNDAFNSNVKAICRSIGDTIGLFDSIMERDNQALYKAKDDCEYMRKMISGVNEEKTDFSTIEEKKFLCIKRYEGFVERYNNSIQ